jgi:hypothetical protein
LRRRSIPDSAIQGHARFRLNRVSASCRNSETQGFFIPLRNDAFELIDI